MKKIPEFLILWVILVKGTMTEEPMLKEREGGIGVLFVPQVSAIFSATTWTLIFEIDSNKATQAMENLQSLREKEQNLLKQSRVKTLKAYSKTNQTIIDAIQQAEREFQQYLMRLRAPTPTVQKKRRQSRSLLPQIGYLYNFLYGSATDDDVNVLQKQVDQLFDRQERIIHIEKAHLTTFKAIQSQLDRQQQQLQQEVNLTATLFDVLNQTIMETKEQPLIHVIWQRDLLTSIHTFRDNVRELNRALDRLQTGYLSMMLLPPDQLQTALANIQQQLPGHLKLVMNIDDINVLKYYQIPLAKQLPSEGKIRGYITLPLANTRQFFDVYKATPFPSQSMGNKTGRFQWNGNPQYMAVTTDHSQFLLLGEEFNTDHCIKSSPMICPNQYQALETVEHDCLYQLFTGRFNLYEDKTKYPCHFRSFHSDRPVLQAISEDLWAISVNRPTNLQINCLDPQHPSRPLKAIPDLKVTKDKWLHLPAFCTATMEGMTIPLRLKGKTTTNFTQMTQFTTPVDSEQLMELHQQSLQNEKTSKEFAKALQEAHQLVQQTGKDDHTQIQQAMSYLAHQVESIPDRQAVQSVHHIYGTLWGLMTLGVISFIGYKVYMRKRNLQRYQIAKKDEEQNSPVTIQLSPPMVLKNDNQ